LEILILDLFVIWGLELDICGLDRLLVLVAGMLVGFTGIAAALTYPTAVLVTPLA
jgi:hypothetical protein